MLLATTPSHISPYQAQISHCPVLSSSLYLLIPPFSLLPTPKTHQSVITRIFFLLTKSACQSSYGSNVVPHALSSSCDVLKKRKGEMQCMHTTSSSKPCSRWGLNEEREDEQHRQMKSVKRKHAAVLSLTPPVVHEMQGLVSFILN